MVQKLLEMNNPFPWEPPALGRALLWQKQHEDSLRQQSSRLGSGRTGSQGHSWCDRNVAWLGQSLSLPPNLCPFRAGHLAWPARPAPGAGPLSRCLWDVQGERNHSQDLLFTARGARSGRDTQGNACGVTSESFLPGITSKRSHQSPRNSLSMQHDTHSSSCAWLRDPQGWAELRGVPRVLGRDCSAMPSSTWPFLTGEPSWGTDLPRPQPSLGCPGSVGCTGKLGTGRGQEEIRASPGNLSHPGAPRAGKERWELSQGSDSSSLSQHSKTASAGQGRQGRDCFSCQGARRAQERAQATASPPPWLLSLLHPCRNSSLHSCASPWPHSQLGPALGSQAQFGTPQPFSAGPAPKDGSGEGLGGSDKALAPSGRGRELCHRGHISLVSHLA